MHEVIHAKLDIVDNLGDEDDNEPRFLNDLSHGPANISWDSQTNTDKILKKDT